jgi:hypothetical protein
VVIGAVLGWLYDRRAERTRDPEMMKRMGVLMATGLIVGDSLLNVAFAGLIAGTNSPAPIAILGEEVSALSILAGVAMFALVLVWLYRGTARAGVGGID